MFVLLKLIHYSFLIRHSFKILSHLNLLLLLLLRKEELVIMLIKDLCLPLIRFSKSCLIPLILYIISTDVLAELRDLVCRNIRTHIQLVSIKFRLINFTLRKLEILRLEFHTLSYVRIHSLMMRIRSV